MEYEHSIDPSIFRRLVWFDWVALLIDSIDVGIPRLTD